MVRDGDGRGEICIVSSEFRRVSEVRTRSRSPAWVSCCGCLKVIRGGDVAMSGEERFLGSPSSPLTASWAFGLCSRSFANKFFSASFVFFPLLLRFSSDVVVGRCSWGREEVM